MAPWLQPGSLEVNEMKGQMILLREYKKYQSILKKAIALLRKQRIEFSMQDMEWDGIPLTILSYEVLAWDHAWRRV
jgi:hypothetical protein